LRTVRATFPQAVGTMGNLGWVFNLPWTDQRRANTARSRETGPIRLWTEPEP